MSDLRHALRALGAARGTAIASVLVLALGTGLNTTILALAYGVLVRPLPYAEPSRLALIPVGNPGDDAGIPLSTFEDWDARMRTVESLAAYATTEYTLRGAGEPRIVHVGLGTDRLFEVLRAPLHGRAFGPGQPGAVLSERLVRTLPIDRDALIGRVITLSDSALPVLGIAPDSVAFPSDRVDLWIPAREAPGIALWRGESDARRFRLIARLPEASGVEQAGADARRVLSEVRADRPDVFSDAHAASAIGLQEQLTAPVRPVLILFGLGAALVLLVACANAGSLLLARAMAREREVAVRVALGASRARMARAVLAEALLIALGATALGAALAFAAVRAVGQLAAGTLPRLHEVAVDGPVLAASLAIAGLVALVCGAAPALHALRTDVAPAFRQTGASRSRRGGRVAGVLVAAQIAASVVLLTGAGLLSRTVLGLLHVDAGIESRNALATTLLLKDTVDFDAGARKPFVEDLLRELRALPGVSHAGIASSFPPDTSIVQVEFRMTSDEGERHTGLLVLSAATPGYFGALGIPLVRGRLFDESDGGSAEPVAVLSETAARRFFDGEDSVGRLLPSSLPGNRTAPPRVVGIVGDVRYLGLEAPAGGTIYVPWDDLPIAIANLAVRVSGDAPSLVPAIRTVIHRVDPRQPVGEIRLVEDILAGTIADRRLRALLISGFGAVALLLAVSGLAAGLVRAVGERRREIAIRTALGSSPRQTTGLVVSNALLLLLPGIAAGLVLTFAAAGGIASLIYGLSPRDPLTYTAATLLVLAAGLAASWLPARRAAAISPAELLRAE